MKRIYLDTNIFVASFSGSNSDKIKKKELEDAFKILSELKDIELVTSMWSITEMVKVLIVSPIKMDPEKVSEIEKDLVNEGRMYGFKIKFLEVSPSNGYDFKEFFYHIRKGILSNSSGVGDNIHSIIMKNNDINQVLTFDIKDFKNMVGITAISPKDIKVN